MNGAEEKFQSFTNMIGSTRRLSVEPFSRDSTDKGERLKKLILKSQASGMAMQGFSSGSTPVKIKQFLPNFNK